MKKPLKGLMGCFRLLKGLFVILLLLSGKLTAQTDKNMHEILLLQKSAFNPYVAFTSDDMSDFFNPQNDNSYPSTQVFDGDFKTCWVAGSAKSEKKPALYVRLPKAIPLDRLILNIFSGYGKSEKLFYANARPKKIRLTLLAAFYPEGLSTEVADLYLIKEAPSDKTVELADTFGVQSISLRWDKDALLAFQKEAAKQCRSFSGENYKTMSGSNVPSSFIPYFILKMDILETYSGKTYNDICVSEIFFNNRFVTAQPTDKKTVNNVYIENDNTLLMDTADKKGMVVYKDPSSVFTDVEVSENKQWAILHYVPNDAVGEGSRIEELYALVDLKNREIVNRKFKEYTGNDTMFIMFSEEDGALFIDAEDYKIELK